MAYVKVADRQPVPVGVMFNGVQYNSCNEIVRANFPELVVEGVNMKTKLDELVKIGAAAPYEYIF